MALDPISAVLNVADTIITRLFPDPAQAANAKLELIKLQQSGELQEIAGQIDINKQEAASSSVFVAGWRPFCGWICGLALGYTYIFYPLLVWVCALCFPHIQPPKLGNDEMLYQLLFGMLGLGGLRSFDKLKGTTK